MFDNLETVLDEAGFTLADLMATRIYLLDYAEFEVINEVYRKRLPTPSPARTTLQVAALPLGARPNRCDYRCIRETLISATT